MKGSYPLINTKYLKNRRLTFGVGSICGFGILFLLLTISCHRPSQILRSTASEILITELSVVELSEDRLPISTHNDEILLIIQTAVIQNNIPVILQDTAFENLLFDTLQTRHRLHLQFNPKPVTDSTYLVVTLIELDEEAGIKAIRQTLEEEVKEKNFLKRGQQARLDRLLKYDDFLGWQAIPFISIKAGSHRLLRFEGLQLFDRFEYVLRVEGR